jgi:hypothetical protein
VTCCAPPTARRWRIGRDSDDALLAAALLWRVFYSVVPLPLGAITMSRFRKTDPDVLERRAAETRLGAFL